MLTENIQFNVPQQIFTVFYAITWGTAANSQPRWKAFAWGAIRRDPASMRRACMSFLILNVLPLIYFVSVMCGLNAPAWKDLVTPGKIFISTLPSLAPFGFYRVWTALMQQCGEVFYGPLPKRDSGPGDPVLRPPRWKEIGIRL